MSMYKKERKKKKLANYHTVFKASRSTSYLRLRCYVYRLHTRNNQIYNIIEEKSKYYFTNRREMVKIRKSLLYTLRVTKIKFTSFFLKIKTCVLKRYSKNFSRHFFKAKKFIS